MKGLWALRGYAKRYWREIVILFLLMGATAVLTAAVIATTLPIFERLFASLESADAPARAQRLREIYHLGALFFALLVGSSLAEAGSLFVGDLLGQNVLYSLRCDVFRHLQLLSLRFYENRRSGELVSRVNNDTAMLQYVLTNSLTGLVIGPLTAILLIAKMATISWKLTLIMAVIGPTVALVTQKMSGYSKRYSLQVQARLADLSALVQESFALTRVIKMFGLERIIARRFDGAGREVWRAEMRGARVRALNSMVAGSVVGFALGSVLMLGAVLIIRGDLTGAGLMTFVLAMQTVGMQINRVARIAMAVQRAEASALRTLELLEEVPEIQDRPDAVQLTEMKGDIRFEHVTFAYEPERPVLSDVSLHLRPGEVVALVGPSGAGKSTIANLVPRLYDIQEGRVLVDGRDVRDVTQESLRSFMAFVPQETLLFGGTVRENIAFARPEASFEEIRAAAQAANATEFIEQLPEGFDTPVGERGAKLSGGQKQRLAIARALLRNPRILLLDEATSSLDQASEQMIHQALGTLLRDRTALIIAHRLSTVQNADRILVIDRGRILEEGTHDQLMARQGLYWRLYESARHSAEAVPGEAPAATSLLE